MKIIGTSIGTVATLLAFAFAAVMLVPAVLGYERYVILTGSMAGTYDPGSIVYAKPVATEELEVGDVITYAPPPGETPTPLVTHRIAKIALQADGTRTYRTKGDANEALDRWTFTLPAATQARVEHSVPHVGHVISALSDRRTRMLVIGAPAMLIALLVLAGLFRESAAARRSAAPRPTRSAWTRI
jgi:signal peptidase